MATDQLVAVVQELDPMTTVVTQEVDTSFVSLSSFTDGGGARNLSELVDVDLSNLTNDSVLVYKTNTGKWTSTTTLNAQNVEGGEFNEKE